MAKACAPLARIRVPRLLLFLVALPVLACGESTTDPGVDPESVSVSAASTDVEVASQVQLTATVSPAAAPQTVAWSSSDQEMATVTSTGLVTVLLQGTVTITATSTVDGTVFGTIDLTAVCPAPRVVSTNPSDGAEWENWVPDPECYDYHVEVDVALSANVLTIQPGTVVGFQDDLHVRIRGTSQLVADGTEELPIVLTGITKERDAWEGVGLEGTDQTHVLAWTTIEYASGDVPVSSSQPAGLKVSDDVTVRLEHSTLQENAGYGLWLGTPAEVTGEGGNTMTANTLGPAWTYGVEVEHVLAGGSMITGNDIDDVVVYPGTIDNDSEWPFGIFRILDPSGQQFDVTGSLTLGPGVELEFEGDDEMLRVLAGGSLTAVGTAQDPVRFTGTVPTPGHWGGVQFIGSNSEDNRLEHVVVEYGGGTDGKTNRANLMIEFDGGVGSRVEVVNSTFRHSEDYGVYVELGVDLAEFATNTLTQNALGPLSIDAPLMRFVAGDNQLTGNAIDEITVHAGTNRGLDDGTTLLDFGLPYYIKRFNSTEWEIRAGLTIQPGVEMQMDPDMILSFEQGGSLSAAGTSTNPIVLERHGLEAWGGLRFIDASGELDYIEITDGGASATTAILTLETIDVDNAPASLVSLTPNVTMSGATYNIWFGFGDTYTTGCISPIRLPPGDSVSDHCIPG